MANNPTNNSTVTKKDRIPISILGGFLGASGDYYFGAKLAVGGSLLSVLLTLLMPAHQLTSERTVLPELHHNNDIDDKMKKEKSSVVKEMIASVFSILSVVWLLLSTKIVTSVANAMSAAAFPLILKDIYGLNEQSLGLSMSAMSAFNGVVNGLFLGPIVASVGGKLVRVITLCIMAMTLVSFILSIVALPHLSGILVLPGNGLFEFLGLTFVLSMFQYVLSTTITGESTAMVKSKEKGTLLGLEHSLFAAARIAAPQAGVTLLKLGGVSAVSAACSGVFTLVLLIWNFYKDSLNYKNETNGLISVSTGENVGKDEKKAS
jgi:hypothetical protein